MLKKVDPSALSKIEQVYLEFNKLIHEDKVSDALLNTGNLENEVREIAKEFFTAADNKSQRLPVHMQEVFESRFFKIKRSDVLSSMITSAQQKQMETQIRTRTVAEMPNSSTGADAISRKAAREAAVLLARQNEAAYIAKITAENLEFEAQQLQKKQQQQEQQKQQQQQKQQKQQKQQQSTSSAIQGPPAKKQCVGGGQTNSAGPQEADPTGGNGSAPTDLARPQEAGPEDREPGEGGGQTNSAGPQEADPTGGNGSAPTDLARPQEAVDSMGGDDDGDALFDDGAAETNTATNDGAAEINTATIRRKKRGSACLVVDDEEEEDEEVDPENEEEGDDDVDHADKDDKEGSCFSLSHSKGDNNEPKLPPIIFNSHYREELKRLAASPAAGIDDTAVDGNGVNIKCATEQFYEFLKNDEFDPIATVDCFYTRLVINDIVRTTMEDLRRHLNIMTMWSMQRRVHKAASNEVVLISWREFSRNCKEGALSRCLIRTKKENKQVLGQWITVEIAGKLTTAQSYYNQDMRKRVEASVSRIMKKLIYVHEWMNGTLTSLTPHLKKFKNLGFVLPEDPQVEDCDITVGDNVCVTFLKERPLDMTDYEEFKAIIIRKDNKASTETAFRKKTREKKLAKKRSSAKKNRTGEAEESTNDDAAQPKASSSSAVSLC